MMIIPWKRTTSRLTLLRWFILILAASPLAGCDLLRALMDPGESNVPRIITVQAGHTEWLPAERLFLTFDKVTQDSRCPLNVVCVWEGDGAAMITLRGYDGASAACTLHTTLEPKSAKLKGLTMKLKTLSPYPVYGIPIEPSQYTVSLEVKKDDRNTR